MSTTQKQPQFKTQWNYKAMPSKQSDKTKMTVPGEALTATQHLKRQVNGLSEKTMKVLYDPNNIYPNVKAMDLVDQRKAQQGARQLVADLQKKAKNHAEMVKLEKAAIAKKAKDAEDQRLLKLLKEKQTA